MSDNDFFGKFTCRLSKSLIDEVRARSAEEEYLHGYNEFVEHALRMALRGKVPERGNPANNPPWVKDLVQWIEDLDASKGPARGT